MGVNRQFKATLFSGLFSEPNNLRELYNALADTNYGEDTPIEINTLDNVFFNDLKNDVSFTIGGKYVVLLEHQSTINANMPLRCLMYIARVYEKITEDRAIYQEKQINIPTPEFIVLYNGINPFPSEKTLRLSDAYISKDEKHEQIGSLDLTVRVVNINPGYNDELLQKSEALYGYTALVEYIRRSKSNGANLHDAINEAIKWGVTEGILKAFLTAQGSEVTGMLMTEFNIDIAKEVWQEEAREDALEEAREEYREELKAKNETITQQATEIERKEAEINDKNAEIERLQAKLEELGEK